MAHSYEIHSYTMDHGHGLVNKKKKAKVSDALNNITLTPFSWVDEFVGGPTSGWSLLIKFSGRDG